MKKRIYYLIISSILLCLNPTIYGQAFEGIEINPKKLKNPSISLSHFATDIDYIKLETTPECLISLQGPVRAFICDSNIVIISYSNIRILVFDENGKFLNRVGRIGQGPEEYISMSSVKVDTIAKSIFVLDERKKSIIVYDFDNNFLRRIKLTGTSKVRSCVFFNDNIAYRYYDFDSSGIRIITKEGNLVKDINFGVRAEKILDISYDSFSCSEGKLFFSPFPHTKFFTFNEQFEMTVTPGITFTKGNMPLKYLASYDLYDKNERSYNSVHYPIILEAYIIISSVIKNEWKRILYNKDEGWYTYLKSHGVKNDIDYGFTFRIIRDFPFQRLYSFVEPIDVLTRYQSEGYSRDRIKYGLQGSKFETLVENLDVNDNPVLMIVTTKK